MLGTSDHTYIKQYYSRSLISCKAGRNNKLQISYRQSVIGSIRVVPAAATSYPTAIHKAKVLLPLVDSFDTKRAIYVAELFNVITRHKAIHTTEVHVQKVDSFDIERALHVVKQLDLNSSKDGGSHNGGSGRNRRGMNTAGGC